MSIFVVYLKHEEAGYYSYLDYIDSSSWAELVSNKAYRANLNGMVKLGWIPKATELVHDPYMISTGQVGMADRIQALIDEHGEFDFRPVWPEKTADIKWTEGQKISHEVWSEQNRKNIDFSKITEDLCKGVG